MTKRVIANALLLLVSITISLLLCEFATRMLLNPADYLSVATVPDDILGIRVAAGAPGFDRWGFRNRTVPASADIVAVGDSHTYGNTATMADSWPYVVGRLTGRSVYNLALGGYGPNQYYHLLKTRGLTLKPRWVVCGLYMGDDFENAFMMTYGREYWAFLRKGRWDAVDANIWETATVDDPSWHRRVRAWLSRNSILYQGIVHGPVLGKVKGAIQITQASRGADPATTSLVVADARIQEAFRPIGIRDRVNQHSAAVREGMRITFDLLALMDRACRENGCRFVVVLIPTKETVFADHLLRNSQMHLSDVIADLIVNERAAREQLLEFLDRADILHVDTLAPLRSKVGDQLYARSDRDMHPNKNGYRVIGEAVAAFLKERL